MRKSPTIILGGLLIILGSIFAWSAYHKEKIQSTDVCTMEAKICPDGSSVSRTGPHCAFAECPVFPLYIWEFTPHEVGASGAPYTTVSITVKGKSHDLGAQTGSCKEVKSNEKGVFGEFADPGELSRVQCWFAGGGSELGLFQEGSRMVIKSAILDEGTPESGSTRGAWKTLVVI